MVISCHEHLANRQSDRNWEASDRLVIDAADKLGIDQVACSILTPTRPAAIEGCIDCNEWVLDSMKRYPDRILGYCYVNPGYHDAALDEIRRRIDQGFMGIKIYNEYPCNEPVVWPVIELAIELGVPILQHAGKSHFYNPAQPRITDASMIAEVANRYPEAMLICGHIMGGGDWEWAIKALRSAPSAYADTSGSVVDDGVVEMAASVLGADRLLFACDMSYTAGIGKIRSAEIPEKAKQKILGGNMQKLLAARKVASTC
ncbi:MAG TPA: amidohydrolase family protein [Armatimonadota bacterium]|nr:amidohydrolase family protein [Armatimonadota bacterium]